MTQVAFLSRGDQWQPAMVADIKKGDVFYLVVDGVASETKRATGDAYSTNVEGETIWSVDDEILPG